MTIVTLNKKEVMKIIGNLDDKKIDHFLALFGTVVENINDKTVEVEIAPNRPDMLSEHGILRALKSYVGKNTGLYKINLNKPVKNYEIVVESSVSKIRPYVVCAIVKNLKFDDNKIKEIIDIQEKLHTTIGRQRKKAAIGIYPLDKIKLPIRYKAMSPEDIKFRPLEFPIEITGRQILSKHPAGRDYANLLCELDKYPVFIDSDNKFLSMSPVINSHDTGKVSANTKELFIECSGFDFDLLKKILNILVSTLADMGGKVYQMKVKYNKYEITPDFKSEEIKLSLEKTNKLLGLDLSRKDVKKLLGRMGYDYVGDIVRIPAYRVDILHEHDLIEDIAIAYGYNNIIPNVPEISTVGNIDKKEILKNKIAEILTGLGMLETMSYHLVNKDMIKKFNQNVKNFVQTSNSKTEYRFLRKDLISHLMKIFSENIDAEYSQEIFQIGKVFDRFMEREKLAVAITPGNFTKLKQVFDYFSRMLDIDVKMEVPRDSPRCFIDGRTVSIFFNGNQIGYLGEIHPKILDNFKLKMPVALFEIDISDIINYPS